MGLRKVISDTLKPKGRYELKRMAAISAFFAALMYAFIPIFKPEFIVLEFVFWGFVTYSASAIGLSVWNKKIDKE
jgi:hypothetical protein